VSQASYVIDKCEAKGIRVWVRDGVVCCDPANAINSAQAEWFKRHAGEVAAELDERYAEVMALLLLPCGRLGVHERELVSGP
jgi:hypothetical protein